MITPLHLELIMWYHTRGGDPENINAPATSEYAMWLAREGMLQIQAEPSRGKYITTPKGEAWLKHILATPFPVMTWTIPAPDSAGSVDGK